MNRELYIPLRAPISDFHDQPIISFSINTINAPDYILSEIETFHASLIEDLIKFIGRDKRRTFRLLIDGTHCHNYTFEVHDDGIFFEAIDDEMCEASPGELLPKDQLIRQNKIIRRIKAGKERNPLQRILTTSKALHEIHYNAIRLSRSSYTIDVINSSSPLHPRIKVFQIFQRLQADISYVGTENDRQSFPTIDNIISTIRNINYCLIHLEHAHNSFRNYDFPFEDIRMWSLKYCYHICKLLIQGKI